MDEIINGIPLTVLVISLVEWVKRFNVTGKALNAVSMILGVVIGLAYWYSQKPFESFADWLSAIIYGLALGLVASGVYDAVKSAVRNS
ncbi:MAG: hypothetical protein QXS68_05795 [Candidatus Methanomethylicaceae archaeon]